MTDLHIPPAQLERIIQAMERHDVNQRHLLAEVAALRENVKERLDYHSRRLGSLERWRAYIIGGLSVLTAAGGLVLIKLKEWL